MAIISITDPTVGDPTELQKFLDVLANQRTLDAGVDVASRGNLVVNGSFESASGGTPTGWTFTDYTGGSHAIDTTNHAHGARAISFTSTSTANGGGYCESSDFLEVTGSEVYYWFAFRMASAANVSAQITARWYDSSQTFISSSTLFQDTSAPTSLTSKEGVVTSPSTARYVKFRAEGGVPGVGTATGTITFDDIRFRLAHGKQKISVKSASSSPMIEFTDLPTGFAYLEVFIKHLVPATGATQLNMEMSNDNGSTWLTGYDNAVHGIRTGGTTLTYTSASTLKMVLNPSDGTSGLSTLASLGYGAVLKLIGIDNASKYTNVDFRAAYLDSSANDYATATGHCGYLTIGTINAIRFSMSSGNISSGEFVLYGIV